MASLWQELKRRNVVKVALAYFIVGWLILQLVDVLVPLLNLAGWVGRFVFLLLVVGFPLALILAWAYELTPAGIQRDLSTNESDDRPRRTGQGLNIVILGSVVLAVAYLLIDRFFPNADYSGRAPASSPISLSDRESIPLGITRTTLDLDPGDTLALAAQLPFNVGRRSLAVSPDGSTLVYVVMRDGVRQLILRYLDQFQSRPIDGTEGAFSPFFSRDGKWIGYLTRTQLMKISVNGGNPQPVSEANTVFGAAWGSDGNIALGDFEGENLAMVSSDGGEKRTLADVYAHASWVLPEGKGVLATSYQTIPNSIILVSSESEKVVTLIKRGADARYVPTGHIVYSDDGGVMAVPFDLESGTIQGSAVPVLTGVRREGEDLALSQFAFSDNGLLAYIPGSDMGLLTPTWLDQQGEEEFLPLSAKQFGSFSISPDGSQVAFIVRSPMSDVWLYDLNRRTPIRRLTIGGNKQGVVWSADGTKIAFSIWDPADYSKHGIYYQAVDGGELRPLFLSNSETRYPAVSSWGKNGVLVFNANKVAAGPDIWVYNPEEDEEPQLFAGTSASEWGASLSPNGRYIAYTSNDSGEYQVYVKAYPATENRWIISPGSGEEPVWTPDGSALYFRRGNRWYFVAVKTDPTFEAGVPQLAFEGPYANVGGLSYGLSPDGSRIMVLKQPDQPPATRIHIVTNWFTEIEQLSPTTH